MENIGICLPAARLPARRCARSPARHGTLLIFDEVKTGITAGWGGATGALRRRSPTSSRWPSRSAAACPSARSAARQEYMDQITAGQGAAPRHLQRQPARDGGGQGGARRGLHAGGDRTTAIARNRRCSSTPATRSSPTPACRPTRCSSAPRAASRGRRRRSATTATTRPPTSTSPSPSGSRASTAASCCRPASTSSG